MFHAHTRSLTQLITSIFLAIILAGAAALSQDPEAEAETGQGTQATPQAEGDEEDLEPVRAEITVVGSQIKGAKITETLPVTVMDQSAVEAVAATSSAELFEALPANGEMSFNGTDTVAAGGVNAARGDVASINLRGIGSGNTLMLLNGRRLVDHPGTQSEDLVPVTTANLNALPVTGVQQVEVLHDGASAIYGTDAVAGVINTVFVNDFDGYRLGSNYGEAQDTNRTKLSLDFLGGWKPNDGKTRINLMLSYYDGGGVDASERPYSQSSDLRPFLEGTDWEGDINFDNRSTNTAWGQFTAPGRVRQDGTSITTSGGTFHVQPASQPGGLAELANGVWIDDGSNGGSADRNLRYDVNTTRQMIPDTTRGNAFMVLSHGLDNGVELYSEISYYMAESTKFREPTAPLSSVPITISKNAYWNPFGPAGSVNRLPGIDAPDEGMDLIMDRYRFVDTGVRMIDVDNDSYRLLGGARGKFGEWSWDSALVYSEANTLDTTHNRISNTLFQQAVNRTDASAYNPFNGGDSSHPTYGDSTPSDPSTIDSFLIDVKRDNQTTLTMADFRISNPVSLEWMSTPIGSAFGVEFRRTSFEEDRDDRLDGTMTYTDAITGKFSESDVMGSSPTPDSQGSRNVWSAFAELAVPIVPYREDRTMVKSVDLQLAGRYEYYNDVGSVVKPKLALSWVMFGRSQIRAAYSQGFRAPNLQQVHTPYTTRVNTRIDWYKSWAAVLRGDIEDLSQSNYSYGVESLRSGSDELDPETSDNISAGIVLAPRKRGFAATVDYWRIEQKDLVGVFGDANQIALDFAMRLQGSANPNVIRAAPTQDDIDFYAGTGLEPVGEIINVLDRYMNLDGRTTEGIDFGLYFDFRKTRFGTFNLRFNASQLLKAYQDLSDAALAINALDEDAINVVGAGDLMESTLRPEWQATGMLTWTYQNWRMGWWGKYISKMNDTSAKNDETGEPWIIDEWIRVNTFVQYTVGRGAMKGTHIRLGVRNLFDEEPPLADDTFGYVSSFHDSEGRYWYASLDKKF